VAKMTAQIRYGQVQLEKSDRNKKYKQMIKELADKRKKFLKHLRRYDYKRFEYVLEQLDLKYIPDPTKFAFVTRKEAMRKITTEHCDKIKQERLDKYRQYLQSKQLDFLNEKINNLEFIRNEQIECKIPVTITQEEINEVKKQYKELKIKLEEIAEIKRKNEVRDDYEIKL
jgi:small subunit ribosomal protein S15